mmetsp:Transcript_72011/g.192369  ORF Transcript_72011/g.192369 Transcript_72011/m.192369 type:complete len:160 (-) Transcript_72011:43-522(-)
MLLDTRRGGSRQSVTGIRDISTHVKIGDLSICGDIEMYCEVSNNAHVSISGDRTIFGGLSYVRDRSRYSDLSIHGDLSNAGVPQTPPPGGGGVRAPRRTWPSFGQTKPTYAPFIVVFLAFAGHSSYTSHPRHAPITVFGASQGGGCSTPSVTAPSTCPP